MEVAAEHRVDVAALPSPPPQVLTERHKYLRRHPLDRTPAGVAVVEQVGIAPQFIVEIGRIETEVGTDADVLEFRFNV